MHTFRITLTFFYKRMLVDEADIPDLDDSTLDDFIASNDFIEDFIIELGAGYYGTIVEYDYKPGKHQLVFKVVVESDDVLLCI